LQTAFRYLEPLRVAHEYDRQTDRQNRGFSHNAVQRSALKELTGRRECCIIGLAKQKTSRDGGECTGDDVTGIS